MESTPLRRDTLDRLRPPVRRPGFDPAGVTPGIVHLGVGGFHRAHMARYTQEVMEARPDRREWGIVGAGLLTGDKRMAEALQPQDGLYTLVERAADGETVQVVGSIVRVLWAAEDPTAVMAAIDDDGCRIVSLTVTEHGYCLNRSTKKLDPEHPQIKADLADPERPHSAPGIIVEGYRRRMVRGGKAFTALTCDNIQHNGNVLREAVLFIAGQRDPALRAWIEQHASFPNTMVDRITPVLQAGQREYLQETYGVEDNWPVFCERFTQWVIEDRFVDGRPEWEAVGAQFVPDVTPYEFMKLRLLNGSHLAVSGLGRLCGYEFIDESMRDPLIERMMAALMDRETGPTLMPVEGIDLAAYKRTLVERFANPGIKDTVERVNTDAPLNVLVDPIRDRLKQGGSVDILGLALAAWMRRIRGEDEDGNPIEIRHPMAELLKQKAIEGGSDPRPLLGITVLFGELGESEELVRVLGRWLGSLYERGAKETLRQAAEEIGF
ncbi:MAG: mannitol dehydrogenase family protein [Gluconacetobacter diazotrophicus]|nr:mannitol dehydrogenase family protein [Gluconacetobacter diazotrophicus]